MDGIVKKIRGYIANRFFSSGDQSLNNATPLLSSGIIDSISALQLVEYLEKEFNFEFEPHEVDQDNLDTIDIMSNFVKGKINK